MLRRPEQSEQRNPEEAADQEAHRESRHDAGEELLHLPHIEQSTRLPADEHEADLECDREEDEEECRNPDAAGDEDQPRCSVERRQGAENGRRDANESRAARRSSDER